MDINPSHLLARLGKFHYWKCHSNNELRFTVIINAFFCQEKIEIKLLQKSCIYINLETMKDRVEHCDALRILETSRVHKTPQRIAVLDTLINARIPLNVNDILSKINVNQKINKVTVYRILSSFKRIGAIREIETGQGVRFYEMACQHNPVHPHFNCRLCGALTCMAPLTLSQTWDWFATAHNYSIDHININITGTCDQCQNR